MNTLTPSETETLKMFDELFVYFENSIDKPQGIGERVKPVSADKLKQFLLTQLRLARADERKKAYEDGKNAAVDYIKENSKGIYLEFKGKRLEQYTVLGDTLESAREANY